MTPDHHAVGVMALTLFALILFTRDRIPLQTSSLIVLCLLTAGFTLFPYQYGIDENNKPLIVEPYDFFSGFGHEALIAVCALMIIGTGLVKTGALEPIGDILARSWKDHPKRSFLITLSLTAFLSAFVNNTPIVVLLIPVLVSVALRTKTSPSSILMPMGCASLLGGMSTTIGTSTNLLIVSVAKDHDLPTINMFDFFLPAMLASIIGIAFLWLVAPLLLPKREIPLGDTSTRIFTAHLVIPEGSFAVGKNLADLVALTNDQMTVDKIRRSSTSVVLPLPDITIRAGDRLLVHETPERLKSFEAAIGATLYAKDQRVDEEHPLKDDEQQVVEIIVDQRSPLLGRTLQSTRFIETYNMIALAVHRGGEKIESMPRGLGNLHLKLGDILLAQGSQDNIAALKAKHEFLVLDGKMDVPHSQKAPLTIAIMALVILTAATGIMKIAVSSVIGVLALLLTRCINWHDVARSLNISVIMIVVSSLALGEAMDKTEASLFLADSFVEFTQGASPFFILSGLILLMAVFTNIVSNNAAAVIGTPIAINIANSLGLNPEPFVLAVLFGVNMSYATPMAYKTNLLIMSAGSYTFTDFLRVGLPLTLLMWITYSILVPLLYPL